MGQFVEGVGGVRDEYVYGGGFSFFVLLINIFLFLGFRLGFTTMMIERMKR